MDTEPKASDVSPEPGESAGVESQATASGGSSETPEGASAAAAGPVVLEKTSQTQYKLLDDALNSSSPQEGGRAYVHPILFDMLLACGLLIAMAGFTIGLLKIYISHSAQQSITQHNYQAAIAILKGAPFPGLFTVKGRDPQELLNQAMYLEAMDKLDANSEDQTAIRELTQIQPGSKFFDLAQEIVKDHTKPSAVQLEGAAKHQASPTDRVVEDEMPVIPPDPKEEH